MYHLHKNKIIHQETLVKQPDISVIGIATVQLNLNLTLTSAVHACIL